MILAEICDKDMEESLPVDEESDQSPDVTRINDSTLSWIIKEGGNIDVWFGNQQGETPDVMELTVATVGDIKELSTMEFTIQTKTPSQNTPVDSGKVRSI